MAPEDDDIEDLYDDEFDFVDDEDDDDDESDVEDSEVDETDDSEVDDESELEAVVSKAEDGSNLDEEPAPRKVAVERDSFDDRGDEAEPEPSDEKVDEFGRPEPAPSHVVHIYEHRNFKRTIDRPFTPEDAEAFASEFNRTSKSYGRFAIAGKADAKPRKALD